MANESKIASLTALEVVLGRATRTAKGNSLYRTEDGTALYVRYSRRHVKGAKILGFYGLRTIDLRYLQQQPKAAVVFHTDVPEDLLLIPLHRMLEFLEPAHAAQDGSYKLQISFSETPELILAGVGRVGLGAFLGVPLTAPRTPVLDATPDRQHMLIQMKIKEIGLRQGFDVWIPRADRSVLVEGKPLGERCADRLEMVMPRATLPVLENIDVLWLHHNRHRLEAMFEVEHSTTIYSGLLRLNDVLIDAAVPSASIVTDINRLNTFLRHVSRRTFEVSGLSKLCSHYTYEDIDAWHVKTR
jgi:hypothetical protein